MKAIIFPGQGSQYEGMGKSLYDSFSQAKDLFHAVDDILGFKLSKKCFFEGAELKDTSIQQLAILTVSLAAYEAFRSKVNAKIDYLSGLSLGEYSCLYAAGVVSLKDLIILVRERALAMQEAANSNPSAMFAVIGLEKALVERIAANNGFYTANINSEKQIVVSFKKVDRERVKSALEQEGAKVVELEVSGGFHSPFMSMARERLKKAVENIEFRDADIPIVSNVDACAYRDKARIKSNLLEQLVSPVLWKNCIEFIVGEGVDLFLEIGPSKVLRGLMRKINSNVEVINIEKKEDLDSCESRLNLLCS